MGSGKTLVEVACQSRAQQPCADVPEADPSPIEDTHPSWLDPDVVGHDSPGDTA